MSAVSGGVQHPSVCHPQGCRVLPSSALPSFLRGRDLAPSMRDRLRQERRRRKRKSTFRGEEPTGPGGAAAAEPVLCSVAAVQDVAQTGLQSRRSRHSAFLYFCLRLFPSAAQAAPCFHLPVRGPRVYSPMSRSCLVASQSLQASTLQRTPRAEPSLAEQV